MSSFVRRPCGGSGPNRGKVELFVDFPINGLDMSPYCRGECPVRFKRPPPPHAPLSGKPRLPGRESR